MPTIAKIHARSASLFVILLVTATLCGPSPAALAVEKAPAAGPPLAVSKALILTPKGRRNPTIAADRHSGAVYLAWAQEVPGPAAKQGKKADPGRGSGHVGRRDESKAAGVRLRAFRIQTHNGLTTSQFVQQEDPKNREAIVS